MPECTPRRTDQPGIFQCSICGRQNPRPIKKPFRAQCGVRRPSPDFRLLALQLTSITNVDDILNNLPLYMDSLYAWSAMDCEVRDADAQVFALKLCRNCKRYDAANDLCKCGGCWHRNQVPCTTRVVMASESCPGLKW